MGALNKFLFGGPGTATSVGDIGLLVARLGFGTFMVYHGYTKVVHDDGIYMMPQFLDGVRAMGFPAPVAFAWMSALTESVGATLIGIGLLTRPAAFALVFNMCVATFVAMKGMPWTPEKAGDVSREPATLFLLFYFLVLIIGGGRFAIDSFLRKSDRIILPKRSDQ